MNQSQTLHVIEKSLDIAVIGSQEVIQRKGDVYEKFSLLFLYSKDAIKDVSENGTLKEETKIALTQLIKEINEI